jgi:hypothetical protein
MQNMSETSAISPQGTRSPSVQWIGVQWRGGFYALLLSGVTAVFKASQAQSDPSTPNLDIELHDGAPVFMRPFNQCFELGVHQGLTPGLTPGLTQGNPLDDEEFRWALIVNVPGASPLGCRVNHVVGPFWDELKSSAIHHEGHDWQLVHPFGGGHA